MVRFGGLAFFEEFGCPAEAGVLALIREVAEDRLFVECSRVKQRSK